MIVGTTNVEPAPEYSVAERELWSEVMDRAIQDLACNDPCCKHPDVIKREVRLWFRSTDHSEGSFLYVCEVLGYSPTATRSAILQRQPAEIGKKESKIKVSSIKIGRAENSMRAQLHA